MPESSAPRRPRLNWFSPLPPAHTDIAHYTLRTIPWLARSCDVVVWTDRHYWPPEIETYAEVRRWGGASWFDVNRADVTVFHLGNNPRFHAWIWDVARRCPGIMVLHDARLGEFFAGYLLETGGGEAAYLAAVQRYHGAAAIAHAERFLRGEASPGTLGDSIPLTALALSRARGAIVHTRTAWEHVKTLARCPVLQLELPFPAGPAPKPRAWDGTLRLIVFGYLSANRRLEAVLEAMARFPRRDRLQLDVLGEIPNRDALGETVRALGLGDVVHLHGFALESELDEALDRAHLAINLRYPTMGEASGSQLRIWSRALASVVSNTGWYADLPSDSVWFVDPAQEVADLHAHFNHALDDPDDLRAMGEAGRRHLVERHDPALYAQELLTGVEEMMQMPASILGELTDSVGRVLAASRMNEAAKAAVARRAATEITAWVRGKSNRGLA